MVPNKHPVSRVQNIGINTVGLQVEKTQIRAPFSELDVETISINGKTAITKLSVRQPLRRFSFRDQPKTKMWQVLTWFLSELPKKGEFDPNELRKIAIFEKKSSIF